MEPTGICVRVVLGMDEAGRDGGSNPRHYDYRFGDLVVVGEVTTRRKHGKGRNLPSQNG